jgi:3-oxoacyl-[acyl-carrier protein] reductase
VYKDMRLRDKVALITGSARGIGRAVALRFAQEGAVVIVNYAHNDCEGSSVVDEIRAMGREAIAIEADVSSGEQVKRMVEMAVRAFDRVDIWMNNAGADIVAEFADTVGEVAPPNPARPGGAINLAPTERVPGRDGVSLAGETLEERKLQRLLDVDVKGTFLCCRAIAPVMQAQGGGCIINVSWDHAISGGMAGAYSTMFAAAKGAVHSLSMSLARELAPAIRVNVIAPGWIHTNLTQHQAENVQEALRQEIPMKRWGEPGDVAEAALYLASPEAAFITGQVIIVNGGVIMY